MPFNGAGVYTTPGADFPAVTQTVISSTKYNNVINDIATALSTCLTKDGQQVATGNIPFGGFRATNVGITGIAGSVGTPAINVSDTQTGLYRSAASELAVTVAGTQRGRFDATGLIVTGTVNASTSVVTPQLKLATNDLLYSFGASDVRLQIASADAYIWQAGGYFPTADNVRALGGVANRWTSVFTPIIDSGTTGSLTFKLNNGEAILDLIRPAGVIANRWTMQGGISGSNGVSLFPTGGDANISAFYTSRGTGVHTFQTDIAAPVVQFQVLHTASATRNITVTGSNGGNPTIGVTAGSLAITPAVVIAGASLQVGTTPASATNSIGVPYNGNIASRNQGNSGDIVLIAAVTLASVNNIIDIGETTSAGVVADARSKAGAPSTTDIPAGQWSVWRDTSGATTKLYYNNGGVIQSVALA